MCIEWAAVYRESQQTPTISELFYACIVGAGLARDNHPMKNLLANIPDKLPEELFETLVQTENIHIERIVSKGHRSPKEGWYEQDKNEWVLLLKGAARLEFEDGRELSMGPGDCLEIPAYQRHKVLWTDPDFDPKQSAFYYARVLEIPTPRWVVYDAFRFGIEIPEGAETTHQERACTSPIWYTP